MHCRDDLAPLIHQLQQERGAAEQQQAEAASWQRYLCCTSLPDPRLRPDMNDFFNCLSDSSNEQLEPTMKECEVSIPNTCPVQQGTPAVVDCYEHSP
jgi:hypothetical protein